MVGLELRARHDVQIYRVELPGPKVSKDVPADAKVTLSVSRSHFNELATKGRVRDWREAFEHGDAKATGIDQVMKLIVHVVERQEERARTRKAHHLGRTSSALTGFLPSSDGRPTAAPGG